MATTLELSPAPPRAARPALRVGPPRLPSDRVLGWLLPLAATFFGGWLRFHNLTRPKIVVFDEVYYPPEAKDLLKYGVEVDVPKSGLGPVTPEYVVHPPLGKWVIAIGEHFFSDPHVGARFSVAFCGTLSILILARTARRMFGSTVLGTCAGLLLALDGLHIVMSRTGLLDSLVMFWVLVAFAFLVLDRDRHRADHLSATATRGLWRLRPYRIGAGAALGAACATKWNGVFYLAAFAVMSVLWDMSARRAAGQTVPVHRTIARDLPLAVVAFTLVPIAVYLASWTGWFLAPASHAYYRDWAATRPASGLAGLVPDALRSLWAYHHEMWNFNVHLHTPHAYQSNPWSWLLQGRPVAFAYDSSSTKCAGAQCTQAVLGVGTPAIWWASVLSLPVLIFGWLGRRDWRAAAILVGIGGGYLPWFHYQERTIFSFYAVIFVPYICLGVTYCLGLVMGGPAASETRRTWGTAVAGAYLLLVVVNTMWLFPILVGEVIPRTQWSDRMWFQSWI